jgi:WD40 repeat protein
LGLAALGTEKGTILVWNLQSGELVHRLGEKQQGGHTSRVLSVAFHTTSAVLFSSAEDKVVIEWSLETGEILQYVDTNTIVSMFPSI